MIMWMNIVKRKRLWVLNSDSTQIHKSQALITNNLTMEKCYGKSRQLGFSTFLHHWLQHLDLDQFCDVLDQVQVAIYRGAVL